MESGVAGWQYAYAEPTDCLRVLEVMPDADTFGARSIMFDRETDALTGLPIILTNTDQAVIRYTRRITDTSRFSPLFTDALTWLLASKLAGPVLKGQTGAAAATRCYTAYEKLISKAATIDANQTTRRQSFVPSSVAARRGAGYGTHSFGPYQAYRSEDLTTYPDGLPRLD